MTDAAVPGLNQGNAYRLESPRPPYKPLSTFDDVAKSLWKRRAADLKETKTIALTCDLFLPKLMFGEIRLRETETAAPGCPYACREHARRANALSDAFRMFGVSSTENFNKLGRKVGMIK